MCPPKGLFLNNSKCSFDIFVFSNSLKNTTRVCFLSFLLITECFSRGEKKVTTLYWNLHLEKLYYRTWWGLLLFLLWKGDIHILNNSLILQVFAGVPLSNIKAHICMNLFPTLIWTPLLNCYLKCQNCTVLFISSSLDTYTHHIVAYSSSTLSWLFLAPCFFIWIWGISCQVLRKIMCCFYCSCFDSYRLIWIEMEILKLILCYISSFINISFCSLIIFKKIFAKNLYFCYLYF